MLRIVGMEQKKKEERSWIKAKQREGLVVFNDQHRTAVNGG